MVLKKKKIITAWISETIRNSRRLRALIVYKDSNIAIHPVEKKKADKGTQLANLILKLGI